jgi:uncharacterized membrane protein
MAQRMPFRNRAHEVSRIEAFSDVIFGFAVSLLVVSLEAPNNTCCCLSSSSMCIP